ncbi:MAG: UDP-2,3-diacylglucosamine diphosphatase, partial [Flavobacterium sp.]|nr:UDP-2,3-diacylglucosamine diphosphatase [Flavobacterium sp.]
KNSVKKAVSFISNFETTAAEIAIEKKYRYVVCGHIHMPQKKIVKTKHGKVMYLNSGDWVENLTALEYKNGKWKIFYYKNSDFSIDENKEDKIVNDIVAKILSN